MNSQGCALGCSSAKSEKRILTCFDDIDENLIDQSNERFSWIISKYLNEPIEILYQKLVNEYELLSKNQSHSQI